MIYHREVVFSGDEINAMIEVDNRSPKSFASITAKMKQIVTYGPERQKKDVWTKVFKVKIQEQRYHYSSLLFFNSSLHSSLNVFIAMKLLFSSSHFARVTQQIDTSYPSLHSHHSIDLYLPSFHFISLDSHD
jgi:hypothetical protein